jgi:putative endopeptidase
MHCMPTYRGIALTGLYIAGDIHQNLIERSPQWEKILFLLDGSPTRDEVRLRRMNRVHSPSLLKASWICMAMKSNFFNKTQRNVSGFCRLQRSLSGETSRKNYLAHQPPRYPSTARGLFFSLFLLFLFSVGGSAQQPKPVAESIRGLDSRLMDTGADPCVDFAKYACGNFDKLYPIRANEMSSTPGAGASQKIRSVLKDILVNDALPGNHTPEERLLGHYYVACMNVDAVNIKGLNALKPLLSAIDGLSDKEQLPALLARIQMFGVESFFYISDSPDSLHASQTIAILDQPELGLETDENYMSMDLKIVVLREMYVAHIAAMLALSGKNSSDNQMLANAVVALESQLVGDFLKPEIHRNPVARYHMLTSDELEQLTPSFNWKEFFAGIGVRGLVKVNVFSPVYIQRVAQVMNTSDLATLRSFLRWRVLSSVPGADLPTSLDREKFSFEGKVMLGLKEQTSREGRCLSSVTSEISGPAAAAVIHKMFSTEEIKSVERIAERVELALSHEIDGLSWMGPDTKLQAKRKVGAITNNIVRVDTWKGWTTLKISNNDALANYLQAKHLAMQRTFQRIGKPTDKTEPAMSPIFNGAYWTDPLLSMNVNAGSMLSPVYDAAGTTATNYGHIGWVVGHEITHGFDDSGAHYDAMGSLVNWWSSEDKRKFDEKASCFVHEYSQFAEGDLHVNGELTLGENIADNGGLRLAYLAMLEDAANEHVVLTDKFNGFSPERQFFIAFGQEFCGATRPERERVLMLTDPHTLDQFRVNGAVQNMPQFGHAFSCKSGQPMMPLRTCQIW